MLDWENLLTELSNNSFEQELRDAVITCALVQHVNEATGYNLDSKSSLLDLILAYHEDDVTKPDYMPHLGKSDHRVLKCDSHIIVENEHVSAPSKPKVWKSNIQGTKQPASLVDWIRDPEI
ncbi:unnamed protein product [Schistosoma mattheei]|uniref:Uncharacterized protein n=1 Tax=Schistosoma mattheei TaxID=31246 RepID=A0A183NNS6_9TREM|nr:unnamed protein product [Schistosoma mattheei]